MVLLKHTLYLLLMALISLTNGKHQQGKREEGKIPTKPYNPCYQSHYPPQSVGEGAAESGPIASNKFWTPYKDEKCLLVFSELLLTYNEAKTFCQTRYSANLVSIDFRDKQAFLEKFFKSNGVINKVWIGLEYKKSGTYEWSDGTPFGYSNWASGSPKKNSSNCVQMHPNPVGGYGKWADIDCTKKNAVLCEKIQPWPSDRLQNMIISIKKNPVPLGFVYVQLPKEKSPAEIWPWMDWDDISSNYSGVFFRVVGGNAGSFGSLQYDNSPRITSVHYDNISYKKKGKEVRSIYLTGGAKRSPLIYTGDEPCYDLCYMAGLEFVTSGGEVRPINMAMRVWKRRS